MDLPWPWHQAVRRRKEWEAKDEQAGRDTEKSISALDRIEQLSWLPIPREKECFQTAGVGTRFQLFSHREGREGILRVGPLSLLHFPNAIILMLPAP